MKLSSTQKPKKKSRHPSSNPSVGITTLLSVRWWLIPAALHSKRADGGWRRHKPELFHSLHTAEFPSKAAVTPNPLAAVRECHSMVRVWDVLGTLMISSSKNNSKQPGWGWSDRSNLLLTRLSRSFKAFLIENVCSVIKRVFYSSSVFYIGSHTNLKNLESEKSSSLHFLID